MFLKTKDLLFMALSRLDDTFTKRISVEENVSIVQCTITLTRSCNLRCDFCYAQKTYYRPGDVLPFAGFKRIVDFCEVAGVKYIVLTGGEPTLYPQLFDALQYIGTRTRKMIPALTTNGIRLRNKSFCSRLVECGLEYVDISLKGQDGAACLSATQTDCFDYQMEAIHNIAAVGVNFTCSIVLTQNNIDSFCNIVRAAYCHGAKQISFTFQIDNDDSDTKNESYLLNHNPFALVETFISQVDVLNSITRDWWIEYSLPMCAYTEKQINILSGKFAAPCQVRVGNGITFDTQMKAIPCNMYFDSILATLGEEFSTITEYQDIWRTSLRRRKAFSSLRSMPSSDCESCKYFMKCMGACPITWRNYSYSSFRRFKSRYYDE